MEFAVKGRKPASVFRFFEEISAIPRGSYHEEGIADYLEQFAAERGLECHRDAVHNVFIKAPASVGMEGAPALLLQGHTDMVCEKNGDVEHDFLKDPLKLYVDGKYLRAKGTTLGGDNGIAVAVMLALLDGEVEHHPAYECLFTTAEEVGMDGAHAFDYSLISARRMLNLDSEEIDIVTAGCAGGVRSDLTMRFDPEPFRGICLRVAVQGLMGGHSGVNIDSGRANANRLMGRILAALAEVTELHIVRLEGGSKDNAIPRECEALVSVLDYEVAERRIGEIAAEITGELCTEDRGFTVICEEGFPEAVMMREADTRRAMALLCCSQNGVLRMSDHVSGLVEWSTNLGVLRFADGELNVAFFTRSSLESQLDASVRELNLLAMLTGCEIRHHGRSPGWSYAEQSDLREGYLRVFRDVTGRDATVNIIHAGLECGVIRSHLPDMDMISIGPDMKDIHSPAEALDLDSVELFWRILAEFIERL